MSWVKNDTGSAPEVLYFISKLQQLQDSENNKACKQGCFVTLKPLFVCLFYLLTGCLGYSLRSNYCSPTGEVIASLIPRTLY